jgi:hypothetical protein
LFSFSIIIKESLEINLRIFFIQLFFVYYSVYILELKIMDILNFISWIKGGRRIKTAPKGSLLAVGVPTVARDDKYITGAMTLGDAIQSGNVGNTKHYRLPITLTNTVVVDTPRGIIDILGMGGIALFTPDPAYGSSVGFFINNLDLDLNFTNRDNIYVQYSVYYNQDFGDNTIPHLIATGASPIGLGFNLYNANPAVAGLSNWKGELYVYYELYTIN